jgi:O-methyltransferase involved in polyketide biosynthesis
MESQNHDLISPTTHFTGVARERFMPESAATPRINSFAGSAGVCVEKFGMQPTEAEEFAFMMALRYNVMNREIVQKAFPNILELGAGTTPRGMDIVVDDEEKLRNTHVFETDLPAMVTVKKEMRSQVENVLRGFGKNCGWERLHHEQLDVTSADDFERVERMMRPGEVGVISEGLFPYLYGDSVERTAENVRSLLKKRGGIWATDIATRQGIKNPIFEDESSRKVLANLYSESEVDVEKLAFGNAKEAVSFFEGKGFTVERVNGEAALQDGVSSASFPTLERVAGLRGLDPKRIQSLMRRKMFLVLKAK